MVEILDEYKDEQQSNKYLLTKIIVFQSYMNEHLYL